MSTSRTALASAHPLKRKIAAIMAADVAGYSRLVAEDEERTLTELAAVREVFDAAVARAGGRIFNTAGDSVMCEFDSAVEAVRAAISIQDSLKTRNRGVDPGRRLEFRIGMTIGDVVERGGDLLGDGVNLAARLEGLAPPGGICVSRSVHEAVSNKLPVSFRELGPRHVKNMPQPVHAYLVDPRSAATFAVPEPMVARRAGAVATPRARGRLVPWSLAFGVAALAVLAGPRALHLLQAQIAPGDPAVTTPASKPVATGPAQPPPAAGTPPPSGTGAGTMAGGPPPKAVKPPDKPPAAPPQKPPVREAGKEAPRPDPARPEGPKVEGPKVEGPKATPPARNLPADPAAAFASLAREGVLGDPRSFPEFYHNARVQEAKGDRNAALASYAAAAPLAGDVLDPHLRYASLVRATKGPAAARQTYAALARSNPSDAVAIVEALSAEGDDRRVRIEAFATARPGVAVADYLLAEVLTEGRDGAPTLTERRLAFDALDRFLEAAAAGELAGRFVDAAFLDSWLDTARRRRGAIEAVFASSSTRPSVSFARTATSWLARLSLPEPATAVAVRLGERGEFSPTGLARSADPRTGKPTPNLEFEIPASTARSTLYVTYTDRAGRAAGPFPLAFDPSAATVDTGRAVLERYPDSWVSFRPDLPDLLSYAGLVSNRCAITRAAIGFGDEPPREALPLPACDPNGPASMPSGTALVRLPDGTDAVQIQLTYADGSESPVRTFRRP